MGPYYINMVFFILTFKKPLLHIKISKYKVADVFKNIKPNLNVLWIEMTKQYFQK